MKDVFLVDFTTNVHLSIANLLGQFVNSAAVISRYLFHANPNGARLMSPQIALIMHEGDPFEIDWREPGDLAPVRHRVEAGQFHIVPAHTPMEVAWEGPQQATVISFTSAFIERIIARHFRGGTPLFTPQVALSDSLVQNLCTSLCGKIGRSGHHIRACAEAIATQLAIHLLASFGSGAPRPSVIGGLSATQQRLALDYIGTHGRQDFHLNELVAATGLSKRHFQRAFKESFGETPCRYAHSIVMSEAAHQVLTTQKSITDIALDAGFENFSHFSTAFKKHIGMSPEVYRRRNG